MYLGWNHNSMIFRVSRKAAIPQTHCKQQPRALRATRRLWRSG